MNQVEIHDFFRSHGITKYEITPDGVNIHEDTRVHSPRIEEIPFQINEVHGNFKLLYGRLKTLKNGPRIVHGTFDVTGNQLRSLEFCPKFVQGACWCSGNPTSPWETRYLLFSEIQSRSFTEHPKVNIILPIFMNKKHLIPQALKELRVLQNEWEQENA